MSNHYSLFILAADDSGRKVFAADDSGLTRTVRKSSLFESVALQSLSSAAIMKVLTSILFTLCIIPTNAQQRTYSINQLKKHTWTETLTTSEEKSVDTLCFTDKEMISSRTRTWLKNNESHTYTYKNPYYLANSKACRFNYSLPGKVKRGSYIIHGNHDKKWADQFVSMEIIQLDDQELTLYWCVPEGNIGGCDTVTYRSEVWKSKPPKREATVPFYLKRPNK